MRKAVAGVLCSSAGTVIGPTVITMMWPSIDPTLGWTILGGCAVSFVVGLALMAPEAIRWWRGPPQAAVPSASSWELEWNNRGSDRREFWQQANIAYQKWQRNPDPGTALQDLIRSVAVPAGISVKDGRGFWEWVSGPSLRLTPVQARLFDFAEFIYSTASWQLGELEGFDDVRMRLSKFWDSWGRQTPIETVIHEQNARVILESSAPELTFLTYLEMARARLQSTGATGKSGLFRLAQSIKRAA